MAESGAFGPWKTDKLAAVSAGVPTALALELDGAYIQLSMVGEFRPYGGAPYRLTAESGRAEAEGRL